MTLFVPAGSRDSYATASQWNDFGSIVEVEPGYALTIEPQQIRKGKQGVLPVVLTNADEVVTVQFELKLPEGISLLTDNDEYVIEPTDRCDNTHVAVSGDVDGYVKIVCYSTKNHPYQGNDGAVINLPVALSDQVTPGTFLPVEIKSVYLTLADGLREIVVPNTTSTVEILSPYTPGDVNNDGHFTATDIACCISFIMNAPAAGAIEEPADANGDGKITAADVATIVSLILNGSTPAQSPAMRMAPLASGGAGTPAYYMNPITAGSGDAALLEVGLLNPDVEAVTLQCDIVLPEGVTVATDSYGDPIVELAADRTADHVIMANKVGERMYRIVSYSNRNKSYKGTDGVIFTMPLVVNADPGEYEIELKAAYITQSSLLTELDCPDASTTLTVTGTKEFLLVDKKPYTNDKDYTDVNVTYTRSFNTFDWQALYIPFNMSYDEWSDYADIAEIYNVICYDRDNNGMIDEIKIELNKLSVGAELVPNVPYAIRAKQKGTIDFECTGKTLMAAPTTPTPIECSSTKMTYSFYGVYETTTGLYERGAYRLTGGAFSQYATSAGKLDPNRFYLICTPKSGGYNPASLPQKIGIYVNGEDENVSGVENVTVGTHSDGIYYDLMGRRVENPGKGLYIKDGQKIFIK